MAAPLSGFPSRSQDMERSRRTHHESRSPGRNRPGGHESRSSWIRSIGCPPAEPGGRGHVPRRGRPAWQRVTPPPARRPARWSQPGPSATLDRRHAAVRRRRQGQAPEGGEDSAGQPAEGQGQVLATRGCTHGPWSEPESGRDQRLVRAQARGSAARSAGSVSTCGGDNDGRFAQHADLALDCCIIVIPGRRGSTAGG
jgi:hypothetical protein